MNERYHVVMAGKWPSHVILYVVDPHHLNFRIWRVGVEIPQDAEARVIFHDESAASQPTTTADPEKATPFMKGTLKWDGCCDLEFPGTEHSTEHCTLHFCGPEDEPELGKLMKAVYALGPKMEHWTRG